jgi:hypothetical protein
LNWLTILGESEVLSKSEGFKCIGLNKKARLILHDDYPIMAYYNPIILDDILIPIKPLYVQTRYYLFDVRVWQDSWIDEVLSKSEGFKL